MWHIVKNQRVQKIRVFTSGLVFNQFAYIKKKKKKKKNIYIIC